MRFILFVGAGNSLAGLEVSAQIPGALPISKNVYSFDISDRDQAIKLVSSLGSSVKLAQEQDVKDLSRLTLSSLIQQKNFSITDLSDSTHAQTLCEEVKDELPRSRFILPKEYFGVSPVVLLKNKLDELFVDPQQNKVYKTVWAHNFEHWIEKDRLLPFVNARAGMLPPKIARSMVNLIPADKKGGFLVDPFCGSGRILIEASELGYKVAGVDISDSQVRGTLANLNKLGIEAEVTVGDATHLSKKYQDIDAIVTEPFLGKPNLRRDQVDYAVSGLEKLYLGCLKDWHKVLKNGGYIVMVFPILKGLKKEYHTSRVIDAVKNIRYNSLARTIYSRPEAEVRREIVILQKEI